MAVYSGRNYNKQSLRWSSLIGSSTLASLKKWVASIQIGSLLD